MAWEHEMDKKGRKRLFLGLLTLCVVFLSLLAAFLLYLFFNTHKDFSQGFLISLGFLLAFIILGMALGILAIVISILYHFPLGKVGRFFLRIALSLYPIAMAVGKLLGISSQRIQGSFVEVNNQLVLSYQFAVPEEKILVLAPHCLQKSTCQMKLSTDAGNCRHCGGCDISPLLALCRRMGVGLAVVTGGTLARKVIKEKRPKAIVAIACERDLSSGIMDVRPLPTLGVGNQRPEGPCKNTRVVIDEVEEAIKFFLAPAEGAEEGNSSQGEDKAGH